MPDFEAIRKLYTTRLKLATELCRLSTDEETAKEVGMTVQRVKELDQLTETPSSLNMPVGSGKNGRYF